MRHRIRHASLSSAHWLAFVLAGAIRIPFILLNHRPPVSDELDYHTIAINVAHHLSFSMDSGLTAFRPPGYPGFLAAIYAILSPSSLTAELVQGFVDSVTALLLVSIGTKLFQRRKAWGGIVWACLPISVMYSGLLLGETLTAFLLVLLAYLLVRSEARSARTVFFLGLVSGMLILTKPQLVIFILMFLVYRRKFNLKPSHSVGIAFVAFLAVVPWLHRNYQQFGTWSITTSNGINLFVGNNPDATGGYYAKPVDVRVPLNLSELERDTFSRQAAFDFVQNNPMSALALIPRKIAHFVSSEANLLVLSLSHNPADQATSFKEKFRSLPPVLTIGCNMTFYILTLAGLLGMAVSHRNEVWWFTVLLSGSLLCVSIVSFGASRFHFPIEPFLALFASNIRGNVKDIYANLRQPARFAYLVAVLCLIGVWGLEAWMLWWT